MTADNDRTATPNDPERIRERADESRRQVAEDLDELGQRLSTEGMKREAQSALDSAEEIAADVTHDVAERAAQRAEDARDRMAERLERFPLPLALIGLTLGGVLMRAGGPHRPDDARDTGEADLPSPDTEGWAAGAVVTGAGLLAAGVATLVLRGAERDERASDRDRSRGYVVGGVVHSGRSGRSGVRARRRSERSAPPPARREDVANVSAATGEASGAAPLHSSLGYTFEEDRGHFEAAHRERYGEDESFESYLSAYRFGTRLGAADRLSDRSWSELEPRLEERWKTNGRSDWERHRAAVKYGFERVRILEDPSDDPDRLEG